MTVRPKPNSSSFGVSEESQITITSSCPPLTTNFLFPLLKDNGYTKFSQQKKSKIKGKKILSSNKGKKNKREKLQ
jgi:hypothetical protein